MITEIPAWSFLIHVAVGGLVAVLMARQHALLPFMGACTVWLLYGKLGALGGVLVAFVLAFVIGLIDTQSEDIS